MFIYFPINIYLYHYMVMFACFDIYLFSPVGYIDERNVSRLDVWAIRSIHGQACRWADRKICKQIRIETKVHAAARLS